MNAFRRLDQRAGGEETSKLIASKKRAIERRDARDAGVGGVAENRMNDLFRIAALAQDGGTLARMFFRRMVFDVGPALVIEIVQQSCKSPCFFIRGIPVGVGAHAGFDGQRVFPQAFAPRVFAE